MKKELTQSSSQTEESFEAGLERLTKLVSALESQELTLDAALSAFEEGIILSNKLTEKLNSAEARLETLTKGPDGLPSSKPLTLADEPALAKATAPQDEGRDDDSFFNHDLNF
ncbi:MAG: exodeoxyribonuclease VII small subunit [Deltaproteobacteria bacterium]|jgi:exodeoxyribonuclease VII small subunit|nr:exodeoxyribonuclease VII small subunit [Deltaproteobacteria bacterium]